MKFLTDRLCGAPLSISYTLLSDDITKGEKTPMTPYDGRTAYFDDGFMCDELSAVLKYKELSGGGLKISLETDRKDLSEFGLNLPLNFMGKKNGGGWKNQYLFTSPYASENNEFIYCYFTSPENRNFILFARGVDGWKVDYSPYLGGHYFINFKILSSFDKAYGTDKKDKNFEFYVFPADTLKDGLKVISRVFRTPVLYYETSAAKKGGSLLIEIIGECDEIRCGDRSYPVQGNAFGFAGNGEGLKTLTPYKGGKRGLDCTVFVYKDLRDLYERAMKSVDLDALARDTDGNLCEHQCWATAMLRYMLRYGRNEVFEKKVLSLLDRVTETDESKAEPRLTVFDKPYDGFPAYHIFRSGRIQEQFFGVTLLLDAYRYFGDEKYLTYASNALGCLIEFHQKEDGRFVSGNGEDYTTVCCPMIPLADMAEFMRGKDGEKAELFGNAAKKAAEYLYKRGFSFPTEGGTTDEAEEEVEEGSVSCTALSLLYFCAKIERKEEYIKKAKQILDIHDNWVIATPVAPLFYSTLRWWETKWEGDKDGNAICGGHAWTIWRAEADYLYYRLTGDEKYLKKAENGFMSNFSKTDADGNMYACYQPDYITGGGFADDSSQVKFRIAKGFPLTKDYGLSRYAFVRAADTVLTDSRI